MWCDVACCRVNSRRKNSCRECIKWNIRNRCVLMCFEVLCFDVARWCVNRALVSIMELIEVELIGKNICFQVESHSKNYQSSKSWKNHSSYEKKLSFHVCPCVVREYSSCLIFQFSWKTSKFKLYINFESKIRIQFTMRTSFLYMQTSDGYNYNNILRITIVFFLTYEIHHHISTPDFFMFHLCFVRIIKRFVHFDQLSCNILHDLKFDFDLPLPSLILPSI